MEFDKNISLFTRVVSENYQVIGTPDEDYQVIGRLPGNWSKLPGSWDLIRDYKVFGSWFAWNRIRRQAGASQSAGDWAHAQVRPAPVSPFPARPRALSHPSLLFPLDSPEQRKGAHRRPLKACGTGNFKSEKIAEEILDLPCRD